MEFYKIIDEKMFYHEFKKFVEKWFFLKFANVTKQNLNQVFFDSNDVISEVYETMINDFENNNEKYKNLSSKELLSWFCQSAKFKIGEDNKRKFVKNLSTDKTLSIDEKRILEGRLPRDDEEKIKFGDLKKKEQQMIKEKLNIKFNNISNNAVNIENLSKDIEKTGSQSGVDLFNFKDYEHYIDTRQKVSKVMNSKKISNKCKELFNLLLQEFTYKEISEKIKLKLNSVKSRVSNCRQEAAKLMG
tara:strand:- start:1686 stop:2420 length:735 start_codon:yes stop_codon:yes gene_type:complete